MGQLDKEIGLFALPDLREIQFKGFQRFLEQGLLEELKLFPIIESSDHAFEFQLLGEQYRLSAPMLAESEAVKESATYLADLCVPAQITERHKGKARTHTLVLGQIPLMNENGTFVVNGIARVIVNQILRSPGIYYGCQINSQGAAIYSATIISDWGERLRLEMDGKGRPWARLTRRCKVPAIILLLAMGLPLKYILNHVCDPKALLSSLKKQSVTVETKETASSSALQAWLSKDWLEDTYVIPTSMQEAMRELYNQVCPTGGLDSVSKSLRQKLFEKKCELGHLGRLNLNRRLGLNVPENEHFLLPQDVLAAIDCLLRVSQGRGHLDDIDHLKHKRVRSVAELLRGQLRISLNRLASTATQALLRTAKRGRLPSLNLLINSAPWMTSFKELLVSHPLSQFLDQTNPLAELVHKRKISALGPGGLTRRTASFRVRDIHPSHYGRVCPIETSEGMNAGLISSLATHARVNDTGAISNPLYRLSRGVIAQGMVHMVAGEDETSQIAIGNLLALDESPQQGQITPARYQQEFITTRWYQVGLRSVFPLQYFSIAAALIPFLEHNDANRALMGSNMQRQAVPLLTPQKPMVGTGMEAQVALDSGTILVAKQNAKVQAVDASRIELVTQQGDLNSVSLVVYKRANQGTCLHQRPVVQTADTIRRGQMIAEGACTADGELALGQNVFVAYMPWEGYNFEDAVLISERLIYDDVFTSLHIERYEAEARETRQGQEKITNEIPHLDPYLLRHLDQNGLVSLGSWVEDGDVLVGRIAPLEPKTAKDWTELDDLARTPEGRLLQVIFALPVETARETCLRVPSGGGGRVIGVQWIHQETGSWHNPGVVHVYVLQRRRIQVGDKVAGRHGNKGIVSRILPRQHMPYLQDGTPVDMVLSPLGVPSRMNVGQVLECILGLAGNLLGKHYRVTPFDERYEREASRKLVFSELQQARCVSAFPWVFEPDSPGKTRLFDGRTGEPFDQAVTVGKAYMMKLIHQVDDKVHARASGPYNMVTQQPLRGKSRQGGQRMGEMEVWALEGFGASHVLQEMFTVKSDDIHSRSEVLGAIVTGEEMSKPKGVPESFRLLIRELRSLGVNVESHQIVS